MENLTIVLFYNCAGLSQPFAIEIEICSAIGLMQLKNDLAITGLIPMKQEGNKGYEETTEPIIYIKGKGKLALKTLKKRNHSIYRILSGDVATTLTNIKKLTTQMF